MTAGAGTGEAKGPSGQRVPVWTQLTQMKGNFWAANVIEAGERLAYFGVRAVLPLYLVGTALGLTYSEKGLIYMVWALLQCLIPMVSGGYTDAYGYKKSLYVAFSINILGYILMAHANGFWSMMVAASCVGTGTAIFKPSVQGAVAKSLNEGNSGFGFGIFYWVVNVGGFLAPMAAAWARGTTENPTWHYVFYGAALVTLINFIPAILLFREPERENAGPPRPPGQVLRETLGVLWRDQQMLRFLLIISGFWFMFMQLWDLLPNFIDEWVDTRDVGSGLTFLLGSKASSFLDSGGGAKPEILINIDSFAILLLVLPLSWFFGRFRMMVVLVVGMALSVVGFVGAGLASTGMWCGLMIFVFALGEITCSPKFTEYMGMTAPAERKALYMGYSNIPFAVGWAAGNGISGWLYDSFASIQVLARRYLAEEAGMAQPQLEALSPEELLPAVAQAMGGGTPQAARTLLWETYQPWIIWIMLGSVGLASVIAMVFFYRQAQARRQD